MVLLRLLSSSSSLCLQRHDHVKHIIALLPQVRLACSRAIGSEEKSYIAGVLRGGVSTMGVSAAISIR